MEGVLVMHKNRFGNLVFWICIAAVLLAAIVSRGVGLTYNLSIHPDESEFYTGVVDEVWDVSDWSTKIV